MLGLLALTSTLIALAPTQPAGSVAAYRVVLSSGFDHAPRNYTMDPGLIDLGGGRLLVCYTRAAEHYAPDDEDGMMLRISRDGGKSWGPERLLADTPLAADRGCGLSRVNARVYASWTARWDVAPGVKAISRQVVWTHSDDGGETWSSTYVIPATRTGTMLSATGGSTWKVWGDDCVTEYWDRDFGDQCYRSWILRAPIADAVCDTAAAVPSILAESCTLNRNHYGYEYEEPVLVADPWGLLGAHRIAIVRNDGYYATWPGPRLDDRTCYRIDSFDDGHTWSDPVPIFRCWSHPVGLVLANAALVVAVRDPTIGAGRGVLRASWDEGQTWLPAIEHQDPTEGMQIYAGIVELAPGIIGLATSQELGPLNTRTVFEIIPSTIFMGTP